jgi:hypothetical protein
MKIMDIHPGSSVDLILHLDPLKEEARSFRRATVYDAEGEQYILSQTTPPIRKSDLGKSVNITSLIRRGDLRVRCGFFGKLHDIISDYQLNSHKKVLALTVVRTSPIETYNLRLHYRVRPGKDWSRRIEVDSMPVNLIDISLGGTLFIHSNENPIEYGQEIQVAYTDNDGNRHIIPSTVKRVWTPLEMRHTGIEYVAVQFMNMDKDLERELGREIIEIQRAAICKV